MGDKLLLRLNIDWRPIANKYCEGKMKRTLKRVKRREIVEKEAVEENYLSMTYVIWVGASGVGSTS